jgi:FkbM family methyltransferase
MRSGTSRENLVFDVGLNRGQDTANYLAKGFNVVAVEANPKLVEFCSRRFSNEIRIGRLAILEGAIVREGMCDVTNDTVRFYTNGNDAWGTVISSSTIEYGARTDACEYVDVPILDIEDAYDQYGIPFYLKTDIEGADIVCLEALRNKKRRPAYVSMESDIDSYRQVAYEINLLESLGYDAFQVINQKDLAQIISPDSILEYGGSGDFGPWLPADGWRDRRHTLRTHRELSLWHKLFSRHGILRETPLQQPLTSILSRVRGFTIPSWHDTHARHRGV